MNPSQWATVRAHLLAVLAVAPEEREAAIHTLTDCDPAVRAELSRLAAVGEEAERYLDRLAERVRTAMAEARRRIS